MNSEDDRFSYSAFVEWRRKEEGRETYSQPPVDTFSDHDQDIKRLQTEIRYMNIRIDSLFKMSQRRALIGTFFMGLSCLLLYLLTDI